MIMKWLEAERLSVADLLEDLTADEWQRETLCPGWTMQEMAAHLTTSTRTGWWDAISGAVTSGFDFDRMEDRLTRRRAREFARTELIAQIRETAASPKRAPGAAPIDPLVDFLVHGQDIARPLGRPRPMPMEPAIAALEHVRDSVFWGARKRFRGARLEATDACWSAGEGDRVIRETVADLLMLATGRKLSTAGDKIVGNSNTRSK